jgi:multisubunit Na+/H+ antiporter MnhB subunit
MRNIILEKIASLFLILMLLLSIFLLFRGHNKPGGGFIAGIIASTGFIFYGIIYGSERIRKILKINTGTIMGLGLLLILISSVLPIFFSKEPLTSLWTIIHLPFTGEFHLGTPLLFDTGIFIVVTGVVLSIVISIMEVLKWN